MFPKGELSYWRHNWKYELLDKHAERLTMWLVWRLPKKLVYWCSIRLMAHATTGPYSDQIVPELTAMDALKRWEG